MRHSRITTILTAVTLSFMALTSLASAQTKTNYDDLAKAQASSNATQGIRATPPKSFKVPTNEVSPEIQGLIAAPYPPHFNADPKTAADWKDLMGPFRKVSPRQARPRAGMAAELCESRKARELDLPPTVYRTCQVTRSNHPHT
jgi:hypothetical protein